jgi:hypothetical protein
MTLDQFAQSDASIEYNIAKLSVLVRRFLTRQDQESRSSASQEAFFHALEEWASNLPPQFRYFPDTVERRETQAVEVGSVSQVLS